MLGKLHQQEALKNFDSVQNQLILEKDLQQFFKVTPPVKIEGEFREISGSATSQFHYLNLVLKVIEELDIEPVQAFALLEAIRPVIYQKFEAITNRFLGKPILPTSRSSSIVFEAIEVFTRLTDTYDSVIEEAKHFGESQTFIMGSAIHRALSDKARLVLCYSQLYHPVPASVWRHINWLYRTADQFNIFNQSIADKITLESHSLSVRQIYLYIMLLAAAGTRNISSEEISALGELLKEWIKHVGIKKPDPSQENDCLCIDPAKMSTPVFLSQVADKTSKTLFCIDLDKLSERFRKNHIHQKFVNQTRYTLSPWTVDKIHHNWTRFVERSQPRISSNASQPVKVYAGLSMTWSVNPASHGVVFSTPVSEVDVRDKKLDLTLDEREVTFFPVAGLGENRFPPLDAVVIDRSATGYCLQWSDQHLSRLAVDEILIIQDDQDKTCRLGKIVWMKAVSRQAYQTGISIVSSEAIPVLVRYIHPAYGQKIEKISKGFVISHRISGRKHFGILLERKDWKTGMSAELIQGECVIKARLLEPTGQSEKFQSFNIAFFRD